MLGCIIDVFGVAFIVFVLYFVIGTSISYIDKVLRKQTKIKCLCHHEYEPYSAFYFGGVEYDFKCRKCDKVVSVKTVTEDKFNWVKDA